MVQQPYEPGKRKDYTSGITFDDKGLSKKVDDAILTAIKRQATDIHFEPMQDNVQIRMRINGLMEKVEEIPINALHNIINRIKVLSSMDITKSKITQEGYFKYNAEKPVEIYSYIFPCIFGERAVLKLQYKREISLNLDELGMQASMLENLKKALARQNGLILVVGPPGNGKTTTLYAIMNYLNTPDKNLMSFENTIKYTLPNLTQSKPDERTDFSFADGVKGMMDQDPDVALVGDIQSLEVARIVIHSAFYKRIVIARLSANDSINAISYLIDMGIQPFLVTASLNAILAQRIVRRLCDHCKEAYQPSPALLKEIGYKLRPDIQFYKANGCEKCSNTGYSGLTGIFELFTPNETINELIIAKEARKTIIEAAIASGFIPLKKDGIIKAASGITTVEEVLNCI
jgi:type II secretory ATPase GspE/PulE/Tfp pilus assembly ATPase PilB-like protein